MRPVVIGGGLAGCEAALQLAKQGFEVDLYEMRPLVETGAHITGDLAEFVCSNSLGSVDITNASGLLKHELEVMGSFLIDAAKKTSVDAGNALAIDRKLFSQEVERLIRESGKINVINKEITEIPDGPAIVASGPLTSEKLSESIKTFTGESHLHFFDAIAPIVEKDSINFDIAFVKNRYDKGEPCYINCPMDKNEYERFYNILLNAEKIELKEFEKGANFFEGCLPIEVLASRGVDTLRFGPLKPVGLIDDRTNAKNHAVIQLRQDNKIKTLYNLVGFQTNLKWPAQKELIQSIPGLENANIIRYGVMHKNTYINSPKILDNTLQTRKNKDIFFAGQLIGTEGYTESIAGGVLTGINMARHLRNLPLLALPSTTMAGALFSYIAFPEHKNFQPINSNWGIIDPMEMDRKTRKDKKKKNEILALRAIEDLKSFVI